MSLSSRERVSAAIEGQHLDRTPVAAWMHFGSEHRAPRDVAQLHLDFAAAYGWDFLKVMSDFRAAVPPLATFDTRERLESLVAVDWDSAFVAQRECLQHIIAGAESGLPVIESGYNPLFLLLRHIGHDQAGNLARHWDLTERIVGRLVEATVRHVRQLRRLGVFGYFHATVAAVGGAPWGEDSANLRRAMRDADLAVLHEGQGLARILHAHGGALELAGLGDYPHEVLSWSDRHPSNPSLAQARLGTERCLMGGIDERSITRVSLAVIGRQAEEATIAAGPRFILSPGCVVSGSVAGRTLRYLRDRAGRQG